MASNSIESLEYSAISSSDNRFLTESSLKWHEESHRISSEDSEDADKSGALVMEIGMSYVLLISREGMSYKSMSEYTEI